MKHIKRFLVLIVALCSVTMAYAFEDSQVFGKWEITKVVEYDRDRLIKSEELGSLPYSMYIIMSRDHSITMAAAGNTGYESKELGGWRLKGNRLLLYVDEDTNFGDNSNFIIKSLTDQKATIEINRPNKNERTLIYFTKVR